MSELMLRNKSQDINDIMFAFFPPLDVLLTVFELIICIFLLTLSKIQLTLQLDPSDSSHPLLLYSRSDHMTHTDTNYRCAVCILQHVGRVGESY